MPTACHNMAVIKTCDEVTVVNPLFLAKLLLQFKQRIICIVQEPRMLCLTVVEMAQHVSSTHSHTLNKSFLWNMRCMYHGTLQKAPCYRDSLRRAGGIVTKLPAGRPKNRGLITGTGKTFISSPKTSCGAHQPSTKWVPRIPPRTNRPCREFGRSPPSSAEFTNDWNSLQSTHAFMACKETLLPLPLQGFHVTLLVHCAENN